MLIEEAVGLIKKELECVNRNVEENCNRMCSDCDLVRGAAEIKQAYQMAILALEKQIPMKPIGEHYAHMRCPSCNHRIPSGRGSSSRRRDNWCNYCGQKILWGNENDE